MDRTPNFLAEAGMCFSVVKGEVMKLEVSELVDSEPQDPGNVNKSDKESVVVCWDEGHVVVVK